jgi:hypothetical protein
MVMMKTFLNHAKFEEAIDFRSFQKDQEWHVKVTKVRKGKRERMHQKIV